MRLGKIGSESESLLVPSQGLVELSLLPEDAAQVGVRLEKARFESRRPLILGRRFVDLALIREHVAQVVMHLGDVGPHRENLSISRRRLGQPPSTVFALRQRSESIFNSAGSPGVGLAVVIRFYPRSPAGYAVQL